MNITSIGHAFRIEGLVVDFVGRRGRMRALDGIDLKLGRGRSMAIVGESGAGKSTLASVLGRLEPRTAEHVAGEVVVDGRDVYDLDVPELRRLRRESLAFIPQDPIASLDPTMRIGRQIALVARQHGVDASPAACADRLRRMRIADPERTLRLHPHQVSGGMAQRVAIALALVGRPRVIVADEPTAALDASVRNEVVRLLFERAEEVGASVVWLSHDLAAVRRRCDEIAVMFAGRVVEHGLSAEVFDSPRHPYTRALLAADPAQSGPGERLRTISDADRAAFRAADAEERIA